MTGSYLRQQPVALSQGPVASADRRGQPDQCASVPANRGVQALNGSEHSLMQLRQALDSGPRVQVQSALQHALNVRAMSSAKADTEDGFTPERRAAIQKKPNATGLPDRLKAGIEHLSGFAMDDVRVHYNSTRPATVQAHAYAQGNDIHIGPGQDQHLPHEAWHVVQQKQGRVKPTLQMKGVAINDDAGLEQEATVMGARAEQRGSRLQSIVASPMATRQAATSSRSLAEIPWAGPVQLFRHLASDPNSEVTDDKIKNASIQQCQDWLSRTEAKDPAETVPNASDKAKIQLRVAELQKDIEVARDEKERVGLLDAQTAASPVAATAASDTDHKSAPAAAAAGQGRGKILLPGTNVKVHYGRPKYPEGYPRDGVIKEVRGDYYLVAFPGAEARQFRAAVVERQPVSLKDVKFDHVPKVPDLSAKISQVKVNILEKPSLALGIGPVRLGVVTLQYDGTEKMVLPHTNIDEGAGGKGTGGQLFAPVWAYIVDNKLIPDGWTVDMSIVGGAMLHLQTRKLSERYAPSPEAAKLKLSRTAVDNDAKNLSTEELTAFKEAFIQEHMAYLDALVDAKRAGKLPGICVYVAIDGMNKYLYENNLLPIPAAGDEKSKGAQSADQGVDKNKALKEKLAKLVFGAGKGIEILEFIALLPAEHQAFVKQAYRQQILKKVAVTFSMTKSTLEEFLGIGFFNSLAWGVKKLLK